MGKSWSVGRDMSLRGVCRRAFCLVKGRGSMMQFAPSTAASKAAAGWVFGASACSKAKVETRWPSAARYSASFICRISPPIRAKFRGFIGGSSGMGSLKLVYSDRGEWVRGGVWFFLFCILFVIDVRL